MQEKVGESFLCVQTQYSEGIQKCVLIALVKNKLFLMQKNERKRLWCDGVSKIIGHVKTCTECTNKKGKKKPMWVSSSNKCKQYDLQRFKFSEMFRSVDWNLVASILVEHSPFIFRIKQSKNSV
jgi:hypothetical protein